MVAFTFGGACGWDCFKKSGDLLIGYIRLPVEYQDRYFDFLERFGRQGTRDMTANDSRQDFRISSRHPSRYQSCRGKVSGDDLALLQDSCSLLSPHLCSDRTRYGVWNRPIRWKLHNGFLDGVVPNAGENSSLNLGWVEDEQPCGCASSH
jgi:hypothetical protein